MFSNRYPLSAKRLKGFTLIELIVVIAIIAVLAAIIAPNAFKAIEKAKLARVEGDSRSIAAAAYSMYADTGKWPGSNWADDIPNGDTLAGAAPGEGFSFRGNNANMPATWDGPYLEKWPKNPWGGTYYWDYNQGDQNGDGIGNEHVLWIDNGGGPAGFRIPLVSRTKIDQHLDDGNLHTGRIQVWQGDDTNGNLGFILIQGE
ncbi:MAG: prepilin-type N-terminal cleavage/methylation domain-containing protein [Candidatus Omnitrophica bacterium]|nr:prepilin-type N-terminal cleavage/methylation domain-containing protein [Candidatus Omnitrophota bacterium]